MLNKILQAIEEKANQEKERLKKEQAAVLDLLKKEHLQALKATAQKARSDFKQKVFSETEEKKRAIQRGADYALQGKQAEIIANVYEKARQRIENLPDKQFQALLNKMLALLPKEKGFFTAGSRAGLILKKKGLTVQGQTKEEGFIFQSENYEISFLLVDILDSLKQELSPQLSRILFSPLNS